MNALRSMLAISFFGFASVAHAQFRIGLGDVERAVRIARTISDITRRGGSSAGRSSGRTSGTARTSSATRAAAAGALRTGDQYVGVPYVWGGTTPDGFDCSGFVQYVYRKHGVELPRTSRQMANAGTEVPPSVNALQPGDLMLFVGSNGVISHVAMYAGDNQIIHSSSSGNGVRYDDLSTTRGHYYVTHMVAARRVVEDGRSLVGSLAQLTRKVPFDYFDPPDMAPPVRRAPRIP